MLGPGFLDELELDMCGDIFDQIDDLLNFPIGDVEGGIVGGDCDDGFIKGVNWPNPHDAFDGSATNTTVFSSNNSSSTSELPTEFSIPYDEDIGQLGWPSAMVDNSFSFDTITLDMEKSSDNNNNKTNCNGDSHQFETSSPISVLESSNSCHRGKATILSPETVVPGRSRTKRQRPASFNTRSIVSPTSSLTDCSPPFSPTSIENFAESHTATKIPESAPTEHKKNKNKKKKRKLSPLPSAMDLSSSPQPTSVRKCLHCEITKTPQWRMGPMGPKTLCNACGVRHKSGRLFPEYRPAASPTFVPLLHSSSHKKVLEMRNKKMEGNAIVN